MRTCANLSLPIPLTPYALVGFLSFPVVGSALAWFSGVPRREAQALILASIVFTMAYAWHREYPDYFRAKALPGRIMRLVLVSIGFAATISLTAILKGASLTSSSAALALATPLWFLLAVAGLLIMPRKGQRDVAHQTPPKVFDQFIIALLLGMALIAYFKGPAFGMVEMDFGGSTTLTGTVAAILGGITFGSSRGWFRSIGLLLSVYLAFVATSRTGALVFLVLLTAISISGLAQLSNAKSRLQKATKDLALILVCVSAVALPARFSNYYPYFTSRPAGEPGARLTFLDDKRVTEWEGFAARYDRFARLIPGASSDDSTASTNLVGRLEKAENRWEILFGTIKIVSKNPWGHWPQSFEDTAQIRCGRPPLCAYPHNVILEIGYYFGWIPMLLMFFGLLALVIRAAMTLNHGLINVRISAVALLGYLGFAQFSGDLIDNLITVILGGLWMLFMHGPSAPKVAGAR